MPKTIYIVVSDETDDGLPFLLSAHSTPEAADAAARKYEEQDEREPESYTVMEVQQHD